MLFFYFVSYANTRQADYYQIETTTTTTYHKKLKKTIITTDHQNAFEIYKNLWSRRRGFRYQFIIHASYHDLRGTRRRNRFVILLLHLGTYMYVWIQGRSDAIVGPCANLLSWRPWFKTSIKVMKHCTKLGNVLQNTSGLFSIYFWAIYILFLSLLSSFNTIANPLNYCSTILLRNIYYCHQSFWRIELSFLTDKKAWLTTKIYIFILVQRAPSGRPLVFRITCPCLGTGLYIHNST